MLYSLVLLTALYSCQFTLYSSSVHFQLDLSTWILLGILVSILFRQIFSIYDLQTDIQLGIQVTLISSIAILIDIQPICIVLRIFQGIGLEIIIRKVLIHLINDKVQEFRQKRKKIEIGWILGIIIGHFISQLTFIDSLFIIFVQLVLGYITAYHLIIKHQQQTQYSISISQVDNKDKFKLKKQKRLIIHSIQVITQYQMFMTLINYQQIYYPQMQQLLSILNVVTNIISMIVTLLIIITKFNDQWDRRILLIVGNIITLIANIFIFNLVDKNGFINQFTFIISSNILIIGFSVFISQSSSEFIHIYQILNQNQNTRLKIYNCTTKYSTIVIISLIINQIYFLLFNDKQIIIVLLIQCILISILGITLGQQYKIVNNRGKQQSVQQEIDAEFFDNSFVSFSDEVDSKENNLKRIGEKSRQRSVQSIFDINMSQFYQNQSQMNQSYYEDR